MGPPTFSTGTQTAVQSVRRTGHASSSCWRHLKCPFHAARFGGDLPTRGKAADPPTEIAPSESRYVSCLLDAYADHKKLPVETVDHLRVLMAFDANATRSIYQCGPLAQHQ
jgi:hypothetical protein